MVEVAARDVRSRAALADGPGSGRMRPRTSARPQVETLGAEVVDVFYVTDEDGQPLTDRERRRATVHSVLAVLATLGLATLGLANLGRSYGQFGMLFGV